MYGSNTSCYIRIPFEVALEGLMESSGLNLKVRYDGDGQGPALGRIDPQAYGDDPLNWQMVLPSPGSAN